jgi:hypothetical protein
MPEAEFSQGEMTHFEGEFSQKKVRFFRFLELEIDKWLDVARFYLHNAPRYDDQKSHLPPERGVGNFALHIAIDCRGHKVHTIADNYQGEHLLIAKHKLRDDRGVERVENLVQHKVHGLHILGTEQQPAQPDDMEREDSAQHT